MQRLKDGNSNRWKFSTFLFNVCAFRWGSLLGSRRPDLGKQRWVFFVKLLNLFNFRGSRPTANFLLPTQINWWYCCKDQIYKKRSTTNLSLVQTGLNIFLVFGLQCTFRSVLPVSFKSLRFKKSMPNFSLMDRLRLMQVWFLRRWIGTIMEVLILKWVYFTNFFKHGVFNNKIEKVLCKTDFSGVFDEKLRLYQFLKSFTSVYSYRI